MDNILLVRFVLHLKWLSSGQVYLITLSISVYFFHLHHLSVYEPKNSLYLFSCLFIFREFLFLGCFRCCYYYCTKVNPKRFCTGQISTQRCALMCVNFSVHWILTFQDTYDELGIYTLNWTKSRNVRTIHRSKTNWTKVEIRTVSTKPHSISTLHHVTFYAFPVWKSVALYGFRQYAYCPCSSRSKRFRKWRMQHADKNGEFAQCTHT